MSQPPRRTPALLGDHPGEIVDRDDAPLLWLGEATPHLMASLMHAGAHGALHVRSDDGSHRAVWIQRCWLDVGEGKMVVELTERRRPS